jgi:carboxyl-terminal processing protease
LKGKDGRPSTLTLTIEWMDARGAVPMEGIPGVTVRLVSGSLSISKVHEGTSAKKEGLLAGDLLIRIGDNIVTGMSEEEAKALLSGESGTNVLLAVTRVEGGKKRQESFETVRDFDLKPKKA